MPQVSSQVKKCAELIKNANTIAVLTGAGISTNAGIPDFRGPQGLYVTKKYDADKIFDIFHFYKDPEPFFEFARDFANLERTLQPTIAHRFLSQLEKMGKLKGVMTQNIDSLHKRAGSETVYEMHGSFWENYCLDCSQKFSYEEMKEKLLQEKIPHCACGGVIKPDVVFFGENVKYLPEAMQLAEQADLFLVVGTSCVVYPAAMIPDLVNGDIVVVNMDEVHLRSGDVTLMVQEDIDRFFSQVAELLGGVSIE